MVRRVAFVLTLLLAAHLAHSAPEPNAKAAKVHRVLVKRPAPGYLFDRFTAAWLDTDSLEDLEAFLKGQTTDPGKPADRLLLAFFYSKQRETVKALNQFRLALAADPGNAAAWMEKAILESRSLNFKQGLADLDEAVKGNPKEDLAIQIAKLRGQLHLRLDQTEDAQRVWQQLLKDHPEDEDLWEDLIELQVDEGLLTEAIKTAADLIAQTKDVYEQVIRQIRLGDLQQRADKRSQALATYSTALAKTGADTWIEKEVLAQVERAFRREEDLTGLERHLKELIKSHPRRLAIHLHHAELLVETGAKDEAEAAYESILKQTPGERRYREAYVGMLEQLGNLEKAIAQVQVLIDSYPEDLELLIRKAGLQHAAEDLPSAKSSIDAYLERSDQSEYAYLRTARLLERYDMIDAAKTTFAALTHAHPDSTAAREAQAAFLHEHDEPERAVEIWTNMAPGADRSELVRIARLLSTRQENQAAFDLLHGHFDDLGSDSIYLSELCQLAIQLDRFEEGLPWARERVAKATNAFELEIAIKQFARLANGAKSLPEIIRDLQDKSDRTLNEHCLLADLLEREGDSNSASAILKEADGNDPAEQILLLDQQIRLMKRRQEWLSAAEASEKLMALPGGRKPIYVAKTIELYERAGAWDKALSWVTEWKQLAPGNTQPWLTEARLLEYSGQPKKAIAVLRRGVQQFDDNEPIRAELAALYADQGQESDAERLYWRLYEDAADVSEKLSWVKALAATAATQDKLPGLIQSFEERRRSNRSSTLPLLSLAEIYKHSGNDAKQQEMLEVAARQRPEDLRLLHQIASIEVDLGKTEDALHTLESAATLDKTNRTQRRIVRLHLENGEEDRAFKLLEEAAGGNAMGPREAEALGETMISSSHFAKAIAFLKPHVEQHPLDYRLGYLYGIALEEVSQMDEATEVFLSLLKIDQELPSPKTSPIASATRLRSRQGYWPRFWKAARKEAPAAAVDLLEQSQSNHSQAYTHRQSNRSRGYNTLPRTLITLPQTLEDLPKLVIPHLALLTQGQDEAVASTHEALRTLGYHYPEISLGKALPQPWVDLESLLTTEDEVNEDIAGYWILQEMHTYWSSELANKVFHYFKSTYPQLAIRIALRAATLDDEDTSPLVEQAFTMIESLEQPSTIFLQSLTQFYQQQGPQYGATVSQERLKGLTTRLLQWYGKLSDQDKGQVFNSLALGLRSNSNLKQFFELIEAEIVRTANLPASSQPRNYRSRSSQQPFTIAPLIFPPELGKFSNQITGLVLSRQEAPWTQNYYGNLTPLDPETLAESIDGIHDPILKCLVAYQLDRPAHMSRTLDDLLANSRTTDHLLLAAAYVGEQDDLSRAMELLLEASKQPLDRKIRGRIDAAIVGYCIQLPEESPLRKHGKDAATRLRRLATSPYTQHALASAMTDLGLEKQADKLMATAMSISSPSRRFGSRTSSYTHFSNPQQSQHERLEKLVDEGRREQAIRSSLLSLTAQTNRFLTPQNPQTHYDVANDLVNSLRFHGLIAETLMAADPGEQANARELSRFAIICLMMDEKERALTALEASLEKRSNNDATRMHYVLALAKEDPGRAIAQLTLFRNDLLGPLGTGIQQILGNSRTFDDRLPILEVVMAALPEIKSNTSADLRWLISLSNTLARDYYEDDVRLQNLFARYPNTRSFLEMPPNERQQTLEEKRSKLHQDLCRALLEVPQLSTIAFSRLTARDLFDGADPARFIEDAKLAFLNYKRPTNYRYYYLRHDQDQIPFYDPDMILLTHAYGKKTLTELTKEIVPALQVNGRHVDAKLWQAQVDFLQSPSEQVIEHAKRFLQQGRTQVRGNRIEAHQPARRLVDLWKLRADETSLTPLLLDHLKMTKAIQNHGNSYLGAYASHLQDVGRHTDTEDLIEGISEVLLGPAEKREAELRKHYNPHQHSSRTRNADFHIFTSLMQELGRYESLTFLATEATNSFWRQARHHQTPPINQFLDSRKLVEPEIIKTLLPYSSWIKDTDRLQLLPRIDQEAGTYFQSFFSALQENKNNAKSKEAALAWIASIKPATLGTHLATAYLKDEKDAVPDILMDAREAILSLPQQRRADWGFFVRHLYSDIAEVHSNNVPKVADFLAALHRTRAIDPLKEIDTFLAFAATSQASDNNAADRAVQLLKGLFESSPHDISHLPKAHAVVDAAVLLAHRAQLQQSSRQAPSTYETQIMGNIISNHNVLSQSRALVCFALDRFANPSSSKFGNAAIPNQSLQQLSAGIRKQLIATTESSDFPPIPDAHALLTAWFGERDLSLVESGIVSNTALSKPEDLDKAIAWLGERSTEDPTARQMEKALRRDRAKRRESPPHTDPMVSSHDTTLMQDSTRPIAWRLALANSLIPGNPSPEFHRDSFRIACGELLLSAWQDRRTTPTAQSSHVISILKSLIEPEEKSPEWKALGEQLIASWIQSKSTSRNPNQTFYQEETESVLKLGLAIDSDSVLARLIKQYRLQFVSSPNPLALLIENGRPQLAKALIPNTGLPVFRNNSTIKSGYTAALEAGLPAFLAKVSDDDIRLYLDVLFKNQADSTSSDKTTPKTTRPERLKEVLVRLTAHSFSRERHKLKCLAEFGENRHELSAQLAPMLDSVAKTSQLDSFIRIGDSSLRRERLHPIQLKINHHAVLGNAAPYIEALEFLESLNPADNFEHNRIDATQKLSTSFERGAMHFWMHDEDERDRADLLPGFRKVVQSTPLRRRAHRMLKALIMHAELNRLEDFDEHFAEVDKDQLGFRKHDAAASLSEFILGENAVSIEERFRIGLAVFEHPFLRDEESHPLKDLESFHVVTQEEILAHTETILAKTSDQPGTRTYLLELANENGTPDLVKSLEEPATEGAEDKE